MDAVVVTEVRAFLEARSLVKAVFPEEPPVAVLVGIALRPSTADSRRGGICRGWSRGVRRGWSRRVRGRVRGRAGGAALGAVGGQRRQGVRLDAKTGRERVAAC